MLSVSEHERLRKEIEGYVTRAYDKATLERVYMRWDGSLSTIDGYRDIWTRYESNLIIRARLPSMISGSMFAKCLGTRFTFTNFAKSANAKQNDFQQSRNRRRSKKAPMKPRRK